MLLQINFQPLAMTGHSDQMSRASDILRHHYGTLSRCFCYSVDIAQLLLGEKVISEATLSTVQSLSKDEASFHLLKTVRHAVHTDHHNLEVFASVLLHFENLVPCAKTILKDCGKCVHIFMNNSDDLTY